MPKYRSTETIDAVKWCRPGDHVSVIPNNTQSSLRCKECKLPLHAHGVLNVPTDPIRNLICPGDYIVASEFIVRVVSAAQFEAEYSEVEPKFPTAPSRNIQVNVVSPGGNYAWEFEIAPSLSKEERLKAAIECLKTTLLFTHSIVRIDGKKVETDTTPL